jgi:hypothetical protein
MEPRPSISAEHLATIILLDELELQCHLADAAIARLRISAEAWKANTHEAGRPIDIVSDCIVCLSAAASIYRLLQPGDRKGNRLRTSKKRCKALRRALGYPPTSEIAKQGTRNSWEHMDERIDAIFIEGKYRSFSAVHVSPRPPSDETFVHHHFDPIAMTIRHGADSINLELLAAECANLLEAKKWVAFELVSGEDAPYPGSAS